MAAERPSNLALVQIAVREEQVSGLSAHVGAPFSKFRQVAGQRAELISVPIWDVGHCIWMNAEVAAVSKEVSS